MNQGPERLLGDQKASIIPTNAFPFPVPRPPMIAAFHLLTSAQSIAHHATDTSLCQEQDTVGMDIQTAFLPRNAAVHIQVL